MASGDPKIGSVDAWSGEVIKSVKESGAVLYHAGPSFYSAIARVALNEAKVKWASRSMDLFKLEQYEDWFLRISPNGTVPVLVLPDRVISDSRDILNYAASLPTGASLRPSCPNAAAKVDRIVAAVYDFPVSDLTFSYLVKNGFPHKKLLKARLARMKQSNAPQLAKKIQSTEASLVLLDNPSSLYTSTLAKLEPLLDEIDSHLMYSNGPFIFGEFTLADVVVSVLVARLHWFPCAVKALDERNHFHSFWVRYSARLSFVSARVPHSPPAYNSLVGTIWGQRYTIVALAVLGGLVWRFANKPKM
eukprot:TRINITY_DN2690_c0_g2_i1.p1 TRINITY_DN2690_c0_g2~~TRINITY_DN2690_c0_g2_i1.p1  ORF type:complete len:304 (+),score=56.71 TRINITY_DN2690_c0_g2_i1:58-969(+)